MLISRYRWKVKLLSSPVLQRYLNIFLVMDDDNPTEVTAGAILTVTVTLIRKDMSTLFGDETVKETSVIAENGVEELKEGAGEPEIEQVKRPVWLKQKRGIHDRVLLKFICLKIIFYRWWQENKETNQTSR